MNATVRRHGMRLIRSMMAAAGILLGCAAPAVLAAEAAGLPVLTPRATLTGARVTARPNPVFGAVPLALPQTYLPWMAPTLVAARHTYLYVVDAGRRQIFRYDSMQQAMSPFADYVAASVRGIAVAGDLSLYVLDGGARQVLHFSVDGRLLSRFGNELELPHPVAMLFDEANGQILVADSLYKHVVVLNRFGHIVAALKPAAARSIEAMASGPDGLYLVDSIGRQVVVVSRNGEHRYTLGEDVLVHPNAIAVDRYNRVFVSDSFDNTIRIFEQQTLAVSIGGAASAPAPASFNHVTGLWLEQDMLYVADSLNGRIQTFQVAPPTQEPKP